MASLVHAPHQDDKQQCNDLLASYYITWLRSSINLVSFPARENTMQNQIRTCLLAAAAVALCAATALPVAKHIRGAFIIIKTNLRST